MPDFRLQVLGRDSRRQEADSSLERARKLWNNSYQRSTDTGKRVEAMIAQSEALRETDPDAAAELARKAELLSKELSPSRSRSDVDKSMQDQMKHGGAKDAMVGPLAQGAMATSGAAPWWVKLAQAADTMKPERPESEYGEVMEGVVPRGKNRDPFIREFLKRRVAEIRPDYDAGLMQNDPEAYTWLRGPEGQAGKTHIDRVRDLEEYAKLRWPRVMGDTKMQPHYEVLSSGRYDPATKGRPPVVNVGSPDYGPFGDKKLFTEDPVQYRREIDYAAGHELRHRGQDVRAKGEVPFIKDYKYRNKDFGYQKNPYEIQAREYELPFQEGYDEFENEVRKYLRRDK